MTDSRYTHVWALVFECSVAMLHKCGNKSDCQDTLLYQESRVTQALAAVTKLKLVHHIVIFLKKQEKAKIYVAYWTR